MYYGGPYLFEKITSGRYLGPGPNVSEGPIFTLWRVHMSLKFRQISRGVEMFLRGSKFYSKISSGGPYFSFGGGTNFGGVHFCRDRRTNENH